MNAVSVQVRYVVDNSELPLISMALLFDINAMATTGKVQDENRVSIGVHGYCLLWSSHRVPRTYVTRDYYIVQ